MKRTKDGLPIKDEDMTLKPKQKIKRKNKKTQLQALYEDGKVTSEEFYKELIIFIKWRLMTDLIKRGYYINGVRQFTFTRDECDDCYTHVLRKILNEYDTTKGTLATYIRWQIRGWGQMVIQKQVKDYKYIPKGFISLDNSKIHNVKIEEYRNNCKLPEETEDLIDYDYFGSDLIDKITLDDVNKIRRKISVFKYTRENSEEWLV